MTVSDAYAVSQSLESGQLLWCDWFNVPDDGSTITITKYNCPEGTT